MINFFYYFTGGLNRFLIFTSYWYKNYSNTSSNTISSSNQNSDANKINNENKIKSTKSKNINNLK